MLTSEKALRERLDREQRIRMRESQAEIWKQAFRGEPCVGCGKPATAVDKKSLCKKCFNNQ